MCKASPNWFNRLTNMTLTKTTTKTTTGKGEADFTHFIY